MVQVERTIVKRIDRSDASILWNYLLIGCESHSESMAQTRFAIISAVLEEMNKVEITSKQTFDLITRTFIELPKLRVSELMHLCSYCVESLRVGDPKCTGWVLGQISVALLINLIGIQWNKRWFDLFNSQVEGTVPRIDETAWRYAKSSGPQRSENRKWVLWNTNQTFTRNKVARINFEQHWSHVSVSNRCNIFCFYFFVQENEF